MPEVLPIAIVSTNQSKYSETFIHNHIRHLPGEIHFLFQGYLPGRYSKNKGDTSSPFIRFSIPKQFKKGQGRKERLKQKISDYLVRNKIAVVLAEYGPSGVEMMDICKSSGIALVVHFHGYDAFRSDILNSYGTKYQQMFQTAKAVIAVSTEMYQQLINLNCPKEKIHLLPYGIDTDFFIPGDKADPATFVTCGRFVKKKGHEYLINAFSKLTSDLPYVKLIMIGDGPLREDCALMIQSLGLENNIEFKGVLDPISIVKIYQQATAYVQHSITTEENDKEGTPLSILEAGACALPVIASNHGGIKDILKDGDTGFLVEERDEEGIYQKMKYILECPDQAANIGRRFSQFVQLNHSLSTYTSQLSDILQAHDDEKLFVK